MVRNHLLFSVLLLVPALIGQAGAQNHTAARDAFYAKQGQLRQHGKDALDRERNRSKAHLCEHAGDGEQGGAGIADCLITEFKTTEHDYVTYMRTIGALLRLPTPGETVPKTPKRLLFDNAEENWQRYRDRACTAMSTQWIDV